MEGFKLYFQNVEKNYSEDEVISLYLSNSNKKIVELATLTGKSVSELYKILHANNIPPNRLNINKDNVIGFHRSGMNNKQIASLTGYTERNIRYILSKAKMSENGRY